MGVRAKVETVPGRCRDYDQLRQPISCWCLLTRKVDDISYGKPPQRDW